MLQGFFVVMLRAGFGLFWDIMGCPEVVKSCCCDGVLMCVMRNCAEADQDMLRRRWINWIIDAKV